MTCELLFYRWERGSRRIVRVPVLVGASALLCSCPSPALPRFYSQSSPTQLAHDNNRRYDGNEGGYDGLDEEGAGDYSLDFGAGLDGEDGAEGGDAGMNGMIVESGDVPGEGEDRAEEANRERITTPYMTKYEKARILGTRALQISCVHASLLRMHS